MPKGAWVFKCGVGDDDPEQLVSRNAHLGRSTWVWDAAAGGAQHAAAVEQARKNFEANRATQRHAADELLRIQCADRIAAAAAAGDVPPRPPPAAGDEPLSVDAVAGALRGAVAFFECLQTEHGFCPGDYSGPMFMLPGLVITLYTCGVLDQVLPKDTHQREIRRYLLNHQSADDGGFPFHVEGPSTMLGTALSYVTLRLLGVDAKEEAAVKARAWIEARGGATYAPSWAKFWLAVLGVYSWDGVNPINPEMWLLPYSGKTGIGLMHPGRFWVHSRMVYLPMSYVYGARGACHETPLTLALRAELYPRAYASVDWNAARNQVAKEDLYCPHPRVQDALWWSLYQTEGLLREGRPLWPLRQKALREVVRLIKYEDRNTHYLSTGPVNKCINALVMWLEEGADSEAFKRHLPRFYDYLWVAEDGMKMQNYNGSQMWDTAFAAQAIADGGEGVWGDSAPCPAAARRFLAGALRYVDATQIDAENEPPLDAFYKSTSKGGWPLSTRDHVWPASDCTAEAIKAAIAGSLLPASARSNKGAPPPLSEARLAEAVDLILSYQNADGGMSTYERARTFNFMELFNPSETFRDIIVEHSYVECTSSCITALLAYVRRRRHPAVAALPPAPGEDARLAKIASALRRAEQFCRRDQRPDGSWYGFWGICFTYGAWFGCAALGALGHTVASGDPAQIKACEYLLSKQRADGGWGESYLSCQTGEYTQLPEGAPSHVVNTAWAMIALLAAGWHEAAAATALAPLHRAARFLLRAQLDSGDFPQQQITGMSNGNCTMGYVNYRSYFPIWALGLYRRCVLDGARRLAPERLPTEEGGGASWCVAISDFLDK